MTQQEALAHVRALYRALNTADSDAPAGDWMHHTMAGDAGCRALDTMLHGWVRCGAMRESELQTFHDTL
jgi:hypothetical protein